MSGVGSSTERHRAPVSGPPLERRQPGIQVASKWVSIWMQAPRTIVVDKLLSTMYLIRLGGRRTLRMAETDAFLLLGSLSQLQTEEPHARFQRRSGRR